MSKWRELFESAEELNWFLKLGGAMPNAEEKKTFFDTVIQKKQENPHYSLFSDFPKEPESEEGISEKAKMARRYCSQILETLRRGKNEESA